MRIDESGAGELIGRHILETHGMDPDRMVDWTSTHDATGVMNGIYFTLGPDPVRCVLLPCTSKQYYDYIRAAGIE